MALTPREARAPHCRLLVADTDIYPSVKLAGEFERQLRSFPFVRQSRKKLFSRRSRLTFCARLIKRLVRQLINYLVDQFQNLVIGTSIIFAYIHNGFELRLRVFVAKDVFVVDDIIYRQIVCNWKVAD